MKKRNLRLLILAALATAALMIPTWEDQAQAATVKADFRVNLRSSGSGRAEKIGTVEPGQIAELLGSEDGWFLVSHQGTVGYSFSTFWSGHSFTTTGKGELRNTASPLGLVLDEILPGTEVIVSGRSGDWLQVEKNGITGFAHRSLWALSEELFSGLPHVISQPVDLSHLNPPRIETARPFSAGDRYTVVSAVPAYASAAQAQAGQAAIGRQPAGTYTVKLLRGGMIELIISPEDPGIWIDPADNDGLHPAAVPGKAQDRPARIGEDYTVRSDLPGFMDSASAAKGRVPAVTVTPGAYFVYNIHKGMINVSTDASVPGAWIDPAGNAQPGEAGTPTPASGDIGARVVAEAQKLLGAPYILGAESWEEGGFDCSGVTQYSYGQLGIELPRRAAQQWDGILRKVTEPIPGDIIAFEKEGLVYHVGIYIGEGRMIHAPKPGAQVKISGLDWWYKNSTVKGFLRPYTDQGAGEG